MALQTWEFGSSCVCSRNVSGGLGWRRGRTLMPTQIGKVRTKDQQDDTERCKEPQIRRTYLYTGT